MDFPLEETLRCLMLMSNRHIKGFLTSPSQNLEKLGYACVKILSMLTLLGGL